MTVQKPAAMTIINRPIDRHDIDDLLEKEWLLTNRRGSYSSSTIVGCNTRRYHGLLIGAVNPLVNRIMAFSSCLEMLVPDGGTESINLSTIEFGDRFSPSGFGFIKRFRRDVGVHFDYELDGVELTKSVYLLEDSDTVGVVYNFTKVDCRADFILRPFAGLRDFHSLQKSYAPLCRSSTAEWFWFVTIWPAAVNLLWRVTK